MRSLPWHNARKQATLGRKVCFSSHIEERVHCGREGTVARERSSHSHSSTKIQALQHQCPPGWLHFPPGFTTVQNNATNWEESVQTYEPARCISRSNHTHVRYENCVESATSRVFYSLVSYLKEFTFWLPQSEATLSFPCPLLQSLCPGLDQFISLSCFPFTMLKFENWAFYRLGKCWATEQSSQPHPFLKEYWRWFLVLLSPENEIRMKTTLFLFFFFFKTKHHKIGFWLFGTFWLVLHFLYIQKTCMFHNVYLISRIILKDSKI